jgi:hypothetical protein
MFSLFVAAVVHVAGQERQDGVAALQGALL